jgi:PAS domain S-box-containing protein
VVDSVSQLRFAAEFAVFLTSFAGLILCLRPNAIARVASDRVLLGTGLFAEGAAAFLYGSFLVTGFNQPALVGLRIAGLVMLALATVVWTVDWPARALLGGVVLWLACGLGLGLTGAGRAGDVCRLVAGALLGIALIQAGRHSIPARIGTIAGGLLLAVVLAVSVSLSIVINRNVVDSAFARYESRASAEAANARQSSADQLTFAKIVAGSLAGDPGASTQLRTWIDGSGTAEARAVIQADLTTLRSAIDSHDPMLFVSSSRLEVAVGPKLDTSTLLALAGSDVVTEAVGANAGARQSVTVVSHDLYALAAYPIYLPGTPQQPAGAIVIAHPLDDVFLKVRAEIAGEDLSLALADHTRVLARAGQQPPTAVMVSVARAALERGAGVSRTADGRFVVTQPIFGTDGSPRAALVLSAPTSAIDQTRRDLSRSLFLVAMGAALVALVLAVFAGERIGGGLRRLTAATTRLRAGELGARSGFTSPDELGVLAEAFDSMAGSLEKMTGDLRRSADDEARLRARLEAVVSGMGEALLAVDRDGIVTECNPAATHLLGWARDDALGRPLDVVVPVIEGIRPVLDDGERVRIGESIVRTSTGVDVPVAVSVGHLDDVDGGSVGSVVVLRDLRREREIEQLKTEFLSNISHELRTPLTPIKGYAHILATRDLQQEQTTKFATEITGGVAQLERVIGQLVAFATAAAGRLDLAPEPVRAADLVGGAVTRWRSRATTHRLTRRVARATPPLMVDPVAMGQVLDELLDNAVKYSPDGGAIVVTTRKVDPDDHGDGIRLSSNGVATGTDTSAWAAPDAASHFVRISVADQGIGISPDRMEELTTEFFQGDGSATRSFSGLGLGLALVDRIVRAHGGWVECSSAPGAGSTFSVVVPDASGDAGRSRSRRS